MYKVILILDQLIKLIPSEKKLLLKSPALTELTAKTSTLIVLFNFYMMWKNYRRQFSFMLEEIFGVRLWPQLNWCSMCMSCNFQSKFPSNVNHQSSLFKFCVWTSQPEDVLNLLLFTVFIAKFKPHYPWKDVLI